MRGRRCGNHAGRDRRRRRGRTARPGHDFRAVYRLRDVRHRVSHRGTGLTHGRRWSVVDVRPCSLSWLRSLRGSMPRRRVHLRSADRATCGARGRDPGCGDPPARPLRWVRERNSDPDGTRSNRRPSRRRRVGAEEGDLAVHRMPAHDHGVLTIRKRARSPRDRHPHEPCRHRQALRVRDALRYLSSVRNEPVEFVSGLIERGPPPTRPVPPEGDGNGPTAWPRSGYWDAGFVPVVGGVWEIALDAQSVSQTGSR